MVKSFTCKNCKNKFQREWWPCLLKPSQANTFEYCSAQCRSEARIRRIRLECIFCKNAFEVWPARAKDRKYCSRLCRYKYQSELRKGEIVNKSGIPWNKGTKGLATAWNKGKPYHQIRGEKNPNWKGDSVSYTNLHTWVRRHLGQPDTCEHCKTSGLLGRQIHWANKSHEYKRDLTDWLRLCVKCHSVYDHGNLPLVGKRG